MNYAAIILAAGASSRMGQSKQMLDIHGQQLLRKTIDTVLSTPIEPVIVVLGADAAAHREVVKDLGVDIVVNGDWQRGMGSSLKAGLSYLTSTHPAVDGLITLVCDQPLLQPETLLSLISTFEETGKPIVASRYAGTTGVPALFHQEYFSKLSALADDQGAKKIILQHPADVAEVGFPGGEIDLDTPEDYQAFLQRQKAGA